MRKVYQKNNSLGYLKIAVYIEKPVLCEGAFCLTCSLVIVLFVWQMKTFQIQEHYVYVTNPLSAVEAWQF